MDFKSMRKTNVKSKCFGVNYTNYLSMKYSIYLNKAYYPGLQTKLIVLWINRPLAMNL